MVYATYFLSITLYMVIQFSGFSALTNLMCTVISCPSVGRRSFRVNSCGLEIFVETRRG